MNKDNETKAAFSETGIDGTLIDDGVEIPQSENADMLSSKGYGVAKESELILDFYEVLYLLEKGVLKVKNEEGEEANFQTILRLNESVDEDAWVKYLIFRDLRSRGYVVRGGFGWGVDFRVYERGKYGEETARYLILSMLEGKPIPLEDLIRVLRQSQTLKKELVLAVMNRRGEIVYYSISELTLR
ncbi:MAG: tRNA-intron lyase [Candidatus Bathyarchaeota archaeon]|jgi:tRNA-intron endonuclease